MTDATRWPTQAEIMLVRRYECSMHGHSFDVIVTMGSADPQVVLCSNCGESWPVGAHSEDNR